MANEDSRRLEEIRADRLHRLRLLQRRQAVEGANTDPAIVIEIEQTRSELGIVEGAIAHPASAETAEAIGAGGRWLATDRKLDLVIDMFRDQGRAQSERMDRMEEHSLERFDIQERKHAAGSYLYIRLFAVIIIGVFLALLLSVAALTLIVGGRF